jgi:hypothetical protein
LFEHTTEIDRRDASGAALVGGFPVVIGALYAPNPTVAVDAATAGPRAAASLVVLPVLGVATGIYAAASGPYSGVPVFCLGSYLGVFGISLAFGALAAGAVPPALLAAGVVLVGLAVVAITSSLLRLVESAAVYLPERHGGDTASGDPPALTETQTMGGPPVIAPGKRRGGRGEAADGGDRGRAAARRRATGGGIFGPMSAITRRAFPTAAATSTPRTLTSVLL